MARLQIKGLGRNEMARKKRSREFKNNRVIDIKTAREERRDKRIQAVTKKARNERRTKEELSHRKAAKILRRRLIYSGIFIIIIAIIGFSIYNIISLKIEQARATAELESLIQEKESLTEELSQVDSREYIEQQARQELRMILPGETLYILIDRKEDDNADR